MATSGTYTWTLDIADVIEDAYERAGLELRSGYNLTTAIRSLNLLLTAWISQGVNLWTIDQEDVTLSANTTSYTMNAKLVDVLDAVVRDSTSTDFPMTRITIAEYLQKPDKTTTGRPNQYAVERNSYGGNTLYIWPAPDTTYTFKTWSMRYIQDATTATDNVDVPKRFLPALIWGLAYEILMKQPAPTTAEAAQARIAWAQMLKTEYVAAFAQAAFEDSERASAFIIPLIKN